MNSVQFLKITGDARAFRQSAWLIENEIARLKVTGGDLSPVGGASGWPSHCVWESLKTASHFNLAIALELRLKCLLRLTGIQPPQGRDGHSLAGIHDRFGAHGGATEAELERLFGQAEAAHPFSLVAFLSTDGPAVPDPPDNRQLRSLADFLAYMDEDVELWRKRYGWERAADGQWRHYIDDLSAFFAFLDATEGFATEMARRRGSSDNTPVTANLPRLTNVAGGSAISAGAARRGEGIPERSTHEPASASALTLDPAQPLQPVADRGHTQSPVLQPGSQILRCHDGERRS